MFLLGILPVEMMSFIFLSQQRDTEVIFCLLISANRQIKFKFHSSKHEWHCSLEWMYLLDKLSGVRDTDLNRIGVE